PFSAFLPRVCRPYSPDPQSRGAPARGVRAGECDGERPSATSGLRRRTSVKVTSAAVVVCTYNRARLLRETLAALQAMTPPRDFDAQIVVVDNNSTDNTRLVIAEAMRNCPIRIIALHESQQGKSFALN